MRLFALVCVAFVLPTVAVSQEPLDALNAKFRSIYARAQQVTIDRSGPILWQAGDDITLFHSGRKRTAKIIPKGYHDRKSIAHVPLAVYVSLSMTTPEGLTKEQRTELLELQAAVRAVYPKLDTTLFPQATLTRSQRILNESSRFIDKVTAAGKVDRKELVEFARSMKPLVKANAYESAKLQIDTMHAVVNDWRRELSAEEWGKLKVVISGQQTPRVGNPAVQYFSKLLNEKGEGKRIIYAEALWDEGRVLKLLATHSVDRDIGVGFFDDETRMFRDLLEDDASRILSKMDFTPMK